VSDIATLTYTLRNCQNTQEKINILRQILTTPKKTRMAYVLEELPQCIEDLAVLYENEYFHVNVESNECKVRETHHGDYTAEVIAKIMYKKLVLAEHRFFIEHTCRNALLSETLYDMASKMYTHVVNKTSNEKNMRFAYRPFTKSTVFYHAIVPPRIYKYFMILYPNWAGDVRDAMLDHLFSSLRSQVKDRFVPTSAVVQLRPLMEVLQRWVFEDSGGILIRKSSRFLVLEKCVGGYKVGGKKNNIFQRQALYHRMSR